MKRRGTPASSPSKFSRCSITHFQKDSWYVCEGGYCSRRGLRRIEDSTKSCTWRNGSWEGNDKNRGCFRAEYACKRLNKAGSEDGINSIKVLFMCTSRMRMRINLPSTDHVHLLAHRVSWCACGEDNIMLSSHRLLLRQCARPKILRSFSSTSRVDFPAKTGEKDEEQSEGNWSVPRDPPWGVWKKTIGKQFEKPHRPCNWLGDKVVEFFPVWY